MAFLDWPENLKISADAPDIYWREITSRIDPIRLQKQIYWHALPTGWEQLDYDDFLDKRRDRIAQVVRDGFSALWPDKKTAYIEATAAELAQIDESQTLEFKSTARWNIRANQQDKKMEHIIVKAVCGFLNSEGGKLLIGVDDDGKALGLEADYHTLNKKDRDGFELWLRQHLENNLSVATSQIVGIHFEQIPGHDVAIVSVAPCGRPVFSKALEGKDRGEFWVRVGNQTKQLHGDDMVEYQSGHWS